jgi:hypothetical protein
MKDRRFDGRLRVSFAIDLHWQDSAAQSHAIAVQLSDISPSGAALRAISPIPVGSRVFFRYQNQTLSGKVRHCEKVPQGFSLGLEFDAGSELKPAE